MNLKSLILMGLTTLSLTANGAIGEMLKKVKNNKMIRCGVTEGVAGFSSPDSKGKWSGLEVEVCRAMSAAVFGNPDKVKYVPLSSQVRFTALQTGEIDVLSRVTTWTLGRDTAQGLNFGPTFFYDGQGFMVRKKDGIKSAKQLKGATICTQQGTTTELNLADYLRQNRIKAKTITFEKNDEVSQAFYKGRCDAFTNDASGLVAERTKYKNPDGYIILPEIISKEPLGPSVRHGDDQWFDIMKWSVYAMLAAEEMGITSKNVDKFLKSKDPKIKRFLGKTKGNGKALGLDEKWAYRIIKMVGNYSEVFEKHVGKQSTLKLERGLNALWTNGGLMYAPPLR